MWCYTTLSCWFKQLCEVLCASLYVFLKCCKKLTKGSCQEDGTRSKTTTSLSQKRLHVQLQCVVFVSSHTLNYDYDMIQTFVVEGSSLWLLNLVKFQSDRQVVFLFESLSFFVLPDSIPVRWVRLGCSPVTHSLLWQVSVLRWLCLGSRPVLCLGPSCCSLCQYLWCPQSAAQVTYITLFNLSHTNLYSTYR